MEQECIYCGKKEFSTIKMPEPYICNDCFWKKKQEDLNEFDARDW